MLGPDDIEIAQYEAILCSSYKRWTGNSLISDSNRPHDLYSGVIPVVSHGTQDDPIFCYANLAAQELFGYDWAEFISLPSRLSAPPQSREARNTLLEQAKRDGFIDNYEGMRVGKSGFPFLIRQTTLWQVVDSEGTLYGQAAAIFKIELLRH